MDNSDVLWEEVKPIENDIVEKSYEDTLYSTNLGKVKIFNIQTLGQKTGTGFQVSPKIRLSLTYHNEKEEIKSYEIAKWTLKNGVYEKTEKVSFSKFDLTKLLTLNNFISELNLGSIDQRRLMTSEDISFTDQDEFIKKIITFAATKEGQESLLSLVQSGNLFSQDIANLSYRKNQLEVFDKLLNDPDYFSQYTEENKIDKTKPEKTWQFFFRKNEWIFGYGIDYKFLGILQSEANVGDPDISDKGSVFADELLGDGNFSTIVELKRPDTPLFKSDSNRTNAWKISNDVFDAFSQILEQKASWQIKSSNKQYDTDGKEILEKAFDPKVILVMGHTDMFKGNNDKETDIKKKTFELFRRDSRNVEVFTYDQLYRRAYFIVHKTDK